MPLKIVSDSTPRAPLPMSGEEMRARGWDAVDIVLVTREPSFDQGYGGGRGEDKTLKDNFGAFAWTVRFGFFIKSLNKISHVN